MGLPHSIFPRVYGLQLEHVLILQPPGIDDTKTSFNRNEMQHCPFVLVFSFVDEVSFYPDVMFPSIGY